MHSAAKPPCGSVLDGESEPEGGDRGRRRKREKEKAGARLRFSGELSFKLNSLLDIGFLASTLAFGIFDTELCIGGSEQGMQGREVME